MAEAIAGKLEQLSLESQPATAPTLPAETIQHILSFLKPADPLTLTTLLDCQLVSRSFAETSLAPHLWRPLFTSNWNFGSTEEIGIASKALDSDEELLSMAWPRGRPLRPSALDLFRVRCCLDRLAEKHLDLLLHGYKDRLVSIDVLCAIGEHGWDALWSWRRDDEEDEEDLFGRRYWSDEVFMRTARAATMSYCIRMRERRLRDSAAFERAVMLFNASVIGHRNFKIENWICDIAIEFMDTYIGRGFRRIESCCEGCRSPMESLKTLVNLVLEVMESHGIATTRSPYTDKRHPDSSDPDLYVPSYALNKSDIRARRIDGRPTTSHLVFMAFLVMICARLGLDKVSARFTELDYFAFLYWDDNPAEGVSVNIADQDDEARVRTSFLTEWKADSPPLVPVSMLLKAHTEAILHLLVRQEASPSNDILFASSLVLASTSPPPISPRGLFQALPFHKLDSAGVRRSLLPMLDTTAARAAEAQLEDIYKEDAAGPTAHRRPETCRLPLRVGDFFYDLREDSDLSVVVGWESSDAKLSRIIPRSKRGRGSTKPAPKLARAPTLPVEYLYRARSASHPVGSPVTLVTEQNAYVCPCIIDEDYISPFMRRCGLDGRTFVGYEEDYGGFALVLSAEMRAAWPDG